MIGTLPLRIIDAYYCGNVIHAIASDAISLVPPGAITGFSVHTSQIGEIGIGTSYYNGNDIVLLLDNPVGFDDAVVLNYSNGNVVLNNDNSILLDHAVDFPVLNNRRFAIDDKVFVIFNEDIVNVATANYFYIKTNNMSMPYNSDDCIVVNVGHNTYTGLSTNIVQITLPQNLTFQDDISVSYEPGNIVSLESGVGLCTFKNAYAHNITRRDNYTYNDFGLTEKRLLQFPESHMIAQQNANYFMTDIPVFLRKGDVVIPNNYTDQSYEIVENNSGVGKFYINNNFGIGFTDTFSVFRNQMGAESDVYEFYNGDVRASIEYDIDPPIGDVIINAEDDSEGIRIHWLKIYNNSKEIIPKAITIQDPLGINKSCVNYDSFGGYINESLYIEIGPHNNRNITMYLDEDDVTDICVCATAQRAKSYIIEVSNDFKNWYPLVYMIADTRTRDFFKYTFNSAVKLCGVRIHYKGEFYATGNTGDISVSAYDKSGDVSNISISHYYSMEDAEDSTFLKNIGTGGTGWAPFHDGIAKFPWELINNNRIWNMNAKCSDRLKYIIDFNDSILVFGNYNTYIYNNNANDIEYCQNLGSEILSYTKHENKLYVGVQSGIIYVTQNGTLFDCLPIIPDNAFVPITALSSYANKLWIGTNFQNCSTPFAKLWAYDNNDYRLMRTFAQPQISVISAVFGNLYIGTKGVVGSRNAYIYIYDGYKWELSYNSANDGVCGIEYSPLTSSVWAALTNGKIVSATLGTSNVPEWNTNSLYASDNHNYLNVHCNIDVTNPTYVGDISNNIGWLCADTELIAYVDSRMMVGEGNTYTKTRFQNVQWPSGYNNCLTTVWRQGTDIPGNTHYYNTDENGDFTAGIVTTTNYCAPINCDFINYASVLPTGVGTTTFNATFEGYICSGTNEKYIFYLNDSGGARLYIDNKLIIDDFIEHGYNPASSATGTFDMLSGIWYPFKLQYYNGYGTNCDGKLSLLWSSPSVKKEYIPKEFFVNILTRINDVVECDNKVYGVSENGGIYTLNPDFISPIYNYVFVRLRDDLGNETPMIVSNQYYGDPKYIFDFVSTDISTENGGTKVSGGRITQIKQNKSVSYVLPLPASDHIYSPYRYQRQFGFYISDPFYVATLTKWDKISILATLPQSPDGIDGLDAGVSVEIYIKTANTRAELLSQDWGEPFAASTIDNTHAPTNGLLLECDISAYSGKWIMYQIVFCTASRNVTPVVHNVAISYVAANVSYFFSTLFDAKKRLENYVNYIRNPDFEYDFNYTPNNWHVYGSGIGISVTDNANHVISGNKSMMIHADDTSIDSYIYTSEFFIEPRLDNQQILVQMNYRSGVGIGTSAFRIDIIDKQHGNAIELSPMYLPFGSGMFNGHFVIPGIITTGGREIELRIVSLGEHTFDYSIDDVYVGPDYKQIDSEPLFRRGLITSNYELNNGELIFGYTTDPTINNTFDFGNFISIIPNKTFEIQNPSDKIRFGMALVSIGEYPVIVDEYAAQLDVGAHDIKWMEYNDTVSVPQVIDYNIFVDLSYHYIFVDAYEHDVEILLPTSIGISGVDFVIKKIDTSTHKVIIIPFGNETIDGNTNYVISTYLSSVSIVSDGHGWYTV